jgi:VanZ family protein
MALIFKLSSQPAVESWKVSGEVTNINIKVIDKVTPNTNTKFNVNEFNHIVRKNAHFFIYLGLGVLTVNALRRKGIVRYKSIALLICVLYAASDEFHQIFVPGRGPGVGDVLIDSAGALVGILIYLGIKKLIKSNIHAS